MNSLSPWCLIPIDLSEQLIRLHDFYLSAHTQKHTFLRFITSYLIKTLLLQHLFSTSLYIIHHHWLAVEYRTDAMPILFSKFPSRDSCATARLNSQQPESIHPSSTRIIQVEIIEKIESRQSSFDICAHSTSSPIASTVSSHAHLCPFPTWKFSSRRKSILKTRKNSIFTLFWNELRTNHLERTNCFSQFGKYEQHHIANRSIEAGGPEFNLHGQEFLQQLSNRE